MPSKENIAKASAVLTSVRASFTMEELKEFKNFSAFWDEVDVQNGYEWDWEKDKKTWKPYYKAAFNVLRKV